MDSFEDFYKANVRMVYAVALTRVGETTTAEDLTQETFLRAWRSHAQRRDLSPRAGRAWLLTTLRNLAADQWRRRALESAKTETPVVRPENRELRMDVLGALAQLSVPDRELIVLRYMLDMNSREIGEALDIPDGTVRRRLAECRSLLAQSLAQWAPERKAHE